MHGDPRYASRRRRWSCISALAVLVSGGGCSVRQRAVSALGHAMAGGGAVFASDNDPELVRDALPFALKTIDMLLAEQPDNRELLLAAGRSYTQYAYGFLQLEAERVAPEDFAAAEHLRSRALNLYLRGRDYAVHGLEVEHRGIAAALASSPEEAVGRLGEDDVPLAFWSGAAWGAAISVGKDRPELLADLPAVRALLERVLALDPTFEAGAADEALIALEAAPRLSGGSLERARQHFARAVALSHGDSASPYVAYAESIAVPAQDRAGFVAMLEKALAVDVDRVPSLRLQNILAQRKARWLLDRVDDYFLPEPEPGAAGAGADGKGAA